MISLLEKGIGHFIGRRILKTGIAVSLSLIITHLLGIASNFAGVVALIGLKQTTRKTYEYARTLILGSILSLILGAITSRFFGSSDLTFGVVTIIDIALIVTLGWGEGMILAVVEMYNIMAQDFPSINHVIQYSFEQMVILFVGVGASLLMNILMPQKFIRHLEEGTKKVHADHAAALDEIRLLVLHPRGADDLQFMVDPPLAANGIKTPHIGDHEEPCHHPLSHSFKTLKHLTEVSNRGKENTLLSGDALAYESWHDQVRSLHRQHQMLREMILFCKRISGVYDHSPIIAKALGVVSGIQKRAGRITPSSFRRIHRALENLYLLFRNSPLPQTREEFETRSSLYHLYLLIIKYLETLETPKAG